MNGTVQNRFRRGRRLLLLALLMCSIGTPLAAQSAANVVVIVNTRSEASRQIAEYYVARRHVPANNVCRITTRDAEEISRTEYDRQIAAPVSECLRRHRLVEQALYLVTTLGVPLRIAGSGGLQGDQSSVDSELTLLYGQLHGEKPSPVAGYVSNPFYRQRNVRFAHPSFPLYLVTRLAAYDVAGAKHLVDQALVARNTGEIVLDLKDDADDDGNTWMRMAAPLLPRGRVLLEESTAVVRGRKGVIAYASWGSNDKHRTTRHTGFSWLPGGIAIEYVSTDGRTFARPPDSWNIATWDRRDRFFGGSPQSLTADLLAEGATGASGHVFEPYLQFCPRPDYVFPAYLRGWNLAESFYSGIRGLSWRNIVVGDPLCALAPAR